MALSGHTFHMIPQGKALLVICETDPDATAKLQVGDTLEMNFGGTTLMGVFVLRDTDPPLLTVEDSEWPEDIGEQD